MDEQNFCMETIFTWLFVLYGELTKKACASCLQALAACPKQRNTLRRHSGLYWRCHSAVTLSSPGSTGTWGCSMLHKAAMVTHWLSWQMMWVEWCTVYNYIERWLHGKCACVWLLFMSCEVFYDEQASKWVLCPGMGGRGGGGGNSHMKRSGMLVGNFCFDP